MLYNFLPVFFLISLTCVAFVIASLGATYHYVNKPGTKPELHAMWAEVSGVWMLALITSIGLWMIACGK